MSLQTRQIYNKAKYQTLNAELGARDISSDIILKIRNAYKVNLDRLQFGVEQMFKEDKEVSKTVYHTMTLM